MSTTDTPNDPIRQKMQLVVIAALIIGCFIVVGAYVNAQGLTSGDEIVKLIVMAAVTLMIAGAGAAWSLIGMGRKVT